MLIARKPVKPLNKADSPGLLKRVLEGAEGSTSLSRDYRDSSWSNPSDLVFGDANNNL